MTNFKQNTVALTVGLISLCVWILFGDYIAAAGTANVKIQILSLCGNGVINEGEQCDGNNLAGQTCESRGFTGGNLDCYDNCAINISKCKLKDNQGGGGGGGGGGNDNSSEANASTQVTFSGRAYPMSKVGLLKDGQLVAQSIAGPDANFSIALSGLSAGNYNFAIFGEDAENRRSALFTFNVFVTKGAITNVSGIFIAPTISVAKGVVQKGENLVIFGRSAAEAEITISVHSEKEHFVKTKTDRQGVYVYNFDTAILEVGSHETKAKAGLDGQLSNFSSPLAFRVSGANEEKRESDKGQAEAKKNAEEAEAKNKPANKADFNGDKKINLVDFSVAAYWYKRAKPPTTIDLNSDGKVDLIDFSIMAYYWTG